MGRISDSPLNNEIRPSFKMSRSKEVTLSGSLHPAGKEFGRVLSDCPIFCFNSPTLDSTFVSLLGSSYTSQASAVADTRETIPACGQLNCSFRFSPPIFKSVMNDLSISIAYNNANHSFPTNSVGLKLKRFSAVTWSSCLFHLVDYPNLLVFTVLLKAHG